MRTILLLAARMAAAALVCVSATAHAGVITYGFDDLADGTSVTARYAGLHFTQATVLQAGISLNETAFPPRSGPGVVFDDGGAIDIRFDTLASSVYGYFTYLDGLTLSAYDSADNLLLSVTSTWRSNLADGSGDAGSLANELLGIDFGVDSIARLVIRGAADGGSFVLDDLTVGTAAVAIPEPATLPLVALGLAALLAHGRKRRA